MNAPWILPIFLPHLGCRQHCLFCNQKVIVQEAPSPQRVGELLENSLYHFPSTPRGQERQIAFYGGSFTALSQDEQISYLREVYPFLSSGLLDSIRISTRPDALSDEILETLKKFGVKTIEVGVQSLSDDVLLQSKRGHTAEDSVTALRRLREWGFEVGAHLMIGLPGDTIDSFLHTIHRILELKPDFVRIHPTLVLRGAPLENLWRKGRYSPLSLNEAVQWLKKGVLKLERTSLPVARLGLQPTGELESHFLAGPYHPALHQLVNSAHFYDMAEHLLERYRNDFLPVFICHPRDLSDLKGQRRQNILRLETRFKLDHISILCDEGCKRGSLGLRTQGGEVWIHRTSLDY